MWMYVSACLSVTVGAQNNLPNWLDMNYKGGYTGMWKGQFIQIKKTNFASLLKRGSDHLNSYVNI